MQILVVHSCSTNMGISQNPTQLNPNISLPPRHDNGDHPQLADPADPAFVFRISSVQQTSIWWDLMGLNEIEWESIKRPQKNMV